MQNRVFFPQSALDQWIVDGTIDLTPAELTIVREGRTYRIVEAVRVMRDLTGADSRGFVGKVKSTEALRDLGAEILEGSMIVGDDAYDVAPGWMGTPNCSFAEHDASPVTKMSRASAGVTSKGPTCDEDLLEALARGAAT